MIKSPAQPDAIVARMDSLADATRLRLLRLLERHELGVVELCGVLQLPQSTVSRHLKVLSDQHWLINRRNGTTSLYRMIVDELDPSARRLWQLAREQTEPWATLHQDQVRLLRLLRDKKASGGGAEAFFAGAAGQWDKLRKELYGSSFGTSALLALLPGGWTVADLGCGTGATSAELAGHVRQVIGVDQSEAMLKAARKRTADLGNVDLRRGDLEALPIDGGTCDAALLLLVLTYVPDPAAVLREMARVLKTSGGKAIVVDLMSHDREDFRRKMDQRCLGFADVELSRLLEQAGFVNVTCRPLPPEPDAKGPALLLATGIRKNV